MEYKYAKLILPKKVINKINAIPIPVTNIEDRWAWKLLQTVIFD